MVADRIQSRLSAFTAKFQEPGYAPKPDAAVIEDVISAAFWASLRHEEGRAPSISLAFVPPEQVVRPLIFDNRLPLDPDVLVRLAPAVERPGIVGYNADRSHLVFCSRSDCAGSARREVSAGGTFDEVRQYCCARGSQCEVH
jgi:hypothetical protein